MAIVGFAADCSSSSGSTSGNGNSASGAHSANGASTATVGKAVTSNDGKKLTVTSFNPNFETPNQLHDSGKKCVTVALDLTNGSKDEWTGIDVNFSLIDSNGVKADFGSGVGCDGPSLADSLVAGGHESATATFEVNRNATAFTFEWQPSLLDSEKFDIPLG